MFQGETQEVKFQADKSLLDVIFDVFGVNITLEPLNDNTVTFKAEVQVNRILEPAMGTGNFFGFMPQEIADGAKLYGVELDRVTGKIATKLYPQAKIQK